MVKLLEKVMDYLMKDDVVDKYLEEDLAEYYDCDLTYEELMEKYYQEKFLEKTNSK